MRLHYKLLGVMMKAIFVGAVSLAAVLAAYFLFLAPTDEGAVNKGALDTQDKASTIAVEGDQSTRKAFAEVKSETESENPAAVSQSDEADSEYADSSQNQLLSQIVSEGSLHQERAIALLSGDRYSDLLAALREQQLTSEETMRNQEYKDFFSNQQEFLSGDLTFSAMECGKSFCAMEVGVNEADGWQSFYDSVTSAEDYPAYVLIDYPVTFGGQPTRRLLFSLDPNVNTIRGGN